MIFTAIFLIILLTLSGGAAIAYLFPNNNSRT